MAQHVRIDKFIVEGQGEPYGGEETDASSGGVQQDKLTGGSALRIIVAAEFASGCDEGRHIVEIPPAVDHVVVEDRFGGPPEFSAVPGVVHQ